MNQSTKINNIEIMKDFQGTTCRGCFSRKNRSKSFCSTCYFKLSEEMRASLYQRFGQGYEEAFVEAVNFLKESKK